MPELTFVADAKVVKLVGATPIIADTTSLNDWNMSVDAIEKKISAKTKAVIVVHCLAPNFSASNVGFL